MVLFLFAARAQALDPCTLASKADVQFTAGQAVASPAQNKSNAAVCDFKVGDMGALGFSALRQSPGEAPDKIIAELEKRNIAATEAKQKAIAEPLMQKALSKL